MESGVHNISSAGYHADPCPEPSLSRGTIVDLLDCPAKAWFNHPRLNPEYTPEINDKFDLGTAAHFMLLEGKCIVEVVEATDWRSKAAQEIRKKARAEGKIAMLESQYWSAKEMVNRAICALAESELGIEDLGSEGDSELTYIWQEGQTWCRCRPDWISKKRDIVIDYKTVGGSAHPDAFVKSIVSFGYDVQDSFYRRGVKAIEGTDPRFYFMAQETEPPYLCSFIALPPMFQEMGRQKVDYGMGIWRYCLSTNNWKGYPNRVAYVDPPAWALAQWEMRAQNITLEG